MEWTSNKDTWPNSELSKFAKVKPHLWHFQDSGNIDDPIVLLLHGAGASTHSWRSLISFLKKYFRVIAVDLPGHGFTTLGSHHRSSLNDMSEDISHLLNQQKLKPKYIVGHSAGAALALRYAIDADCPPKGIISINGALDGFNGLANFFFPLIAKLLTITPLLTPMITRLTKEQKNVDKLLLSTGSNLDSEGSSFYKRLLSDDKHIDGILTMMAQWDLKNLGEDIRNLEIPVCFLVGTNDYIVPPEQSKAAARQLVTSNIISMQDLGHLMHEEKPKKISNYIIEFFNSID